MLQNYLIVLVNSFPILATIGITILLKSKEILTEETKKSLAPIIFKFIIPFLIFSVLYQLKIDRDDFIAAGFAGLIGLILVFAAAFYAKFRNWSQRISAAVVVQMLGFSVGSFAYPFIQLNFSNEVFGKVVIFDIVLFMMMVILGPLIGSYYSNKDEEKALRKSLIQLIKDPVLLTVVFTLLINLLNLEVPQIFVNLATFVSSSFFFLVIVYLSISLRLPDKKKLFELMEIFSFKYGLLTLASIAYFVIFPDSKTLKQALILTIFTPFSAFALSFSQKYSLDEEIIAQLSVFSLLIFIFVYPAIMAVVAGI